MSRHQTMSSSSSEGCVSSGLLWRTLWCKLCSRWYSASLLKPVLDNVFAWIFTNNTVIEEMWASAAKLHFCGTVYCMTSKHSNALLYSRPCSVTIYDVRCLIQWKGCNCVAFVNTGTSSYCSLMFWILLKITDEMRNCLNIYWSYGNQRFFVGRNIG